MKYQIKSQSASDFFLFGFCFLTEKAMFSWKKNVSRYYCQSTQNSLKRRGMWFSAGVRMYVCVCVCVRMCPIFNVFNPDNS